MVRAFTHDEMGRRIDPSWWTHDNISRSSQWYVLPCIWNDAYKRTLAANRKRVAHMATAGFLSLTEWSFIYFHSLILLYILLSWFSNVYLFSFHLVQYWYI